MWQEGLAWPDGSRQTCLGQWFSSVQLLSRVQLFVTPQTAVHQAPLSITNSWNLLKLMSIQSVMPSNHLILSCPLLLPPSIFPNIRIFSNESVLCIRLPKYWSFSFSISPLSEYSGLLSIRIDWFDLLAVQGTLKSLFQHHNSKPWILWHSAFFMVQLHISTDYWKQCPNLKCSGLMTLFFSFFFWWLFTCSHILQPPYKPTPTNRIFPAPQISPHHTPSPFPVQW